MFNKYISLDNLKKLFLRIQATYYQRFNSPLAQAVAVLF
jgi:hypothetical protein